MPPNQHDAASTISLCASSCVCEGAGAAGGALATGAAESLGAGGVAGATGGGSEPPQAARARRARTVVQIEALPMDAGFSHKGTGRKSHPSGSIVDYSGASVRPALLVMAAVGATAAALAFAAACDSTGTLLPNPDAAVEAGTVEASVGDSGMPGQDAAADAIEEPQVADVCGNPPWVTLGIEVVSLDLGNLDGSPLPGAQFTSPLCPGLVKISDDAGYIEGQVSSGVPFYGRLTATNRVSEIAPEQVLDADSTGTKVPMLPTLVETFVSADWSGKNIAILAKTLVDDAGACSAVDKITFSVPGHPEAQVIYLSSAALPLPIPGGTATSTRGIALITGLDAGQFVTLAGTKPGDEAGTTCQIIFQRGPVTGRVPLENGFVSLMPAYVSP